MSFLLIFIQKFSQDQVEVDGEVVVLLVVVLLVVVRLVVLLVEVLLVEVAHQENGKLKETVIFI